MNFRTKVKIPVYKPSIEYENKLFFIGSCFTDSIGNKFKQFFFDTLINPFGVLYNPLSIKNNIESLIDKKVYKEDDIFFHNNLWKSFDFHGDFSESNKEQFLKNINTLREKATDFLEATDFIFITFGTAWVYELKTNNRIVANCHKVAADKFNRRLLNVSEIVSIYNELIEKIRKRNSKAHIIFTLSPIRHLRDGAIENQISKSTLLLAINELKEQDKSIYYFPSYEIVLDDLRDYRFFSDDLIHLTNFSINYIWENICDTFFDKKTINELSLAQKLDRSLSHRIMKHGNKEDLKKFVENIKKLASNLTEMNSEINLDIVNKKIDELEKLLIK